MPAEDWDWGDAITVTRSLGLSCAVQDWVIDVEGQRIFLEANVEGQWLFLPGARERVTPSLVDHLLADE